jgi:hypothetical protein
LQPPGAHPGKALARNRIQTFQSGVICTQFIPVIFYRQMILTALIIIGLADDLEKNIYVCAYFS